MADNLIKDQRSYCMSRVKSKDTSIEKNIYSALHARGWRFRKNVKKLPGKPDIVFLSIKLAVFIDGDFWHGYRFPQWKDSLPDYWKIKIQKNIERDKRNFKQLRKMQWRVLRIWEHSINKNIDNVIERIIDVHGNK